MKHNKIKNTYILRWAKKVMAARLLGNKCSNCGEDDIRVLVFHHNQNEKECCLNTLLNGNYAFSKACLEIKKCELLCGNCHVEWHQKNNRINSLDLRMSELKEKLLEFKKVSKCEMCGYVGENYASLDFHHIRDKKFDVSPEIRKYKKILPHILLEVDKCMVVCKNCHCKMGVTRFQELKNDIMGKANSYVELKRVDRNEIIKMYDGRISQKEIAERLGCSNATVSITINKLLDAKKI